ncbi:hypothetical protein B0H14DRAFT_2283066, partial [Mycena olivaceomarginata]
PPGLASHPTQQERQPGTGRGYARLAVMDGKNIPHRICTVSNCEGPLVNFKNGRFCRDHLGLRDICVQSGPTLHSELPELNGTPGDQVAHTFRARTTYCLQTVQSA